MSLAIDVTKAALVEAGRPDLARLVRLGKKGNPNVPTHDPYRCDDKPLMRKAMLLGHQSHDMSAFIEGGGIVCPACDDALERP